MLNWQVAYLDTLSSLLADAEGNGKVDNAYIQDKIAEMNKLYPKLQPLAAIPNLLELNIRTLVNGG